MTKKAWNMGLTVAAVALLLGLAVLPAAGTLPVAADGHSRETADAGSQLEVTTVTVCGYGPTGSRDSWQVQLSMEEAESLDARLSAANSLEEAYALLRGYGLIPGEESVDAVMQALGREAPVPADFWLPPVAGCFFCQVSATFRWGGALHLGMTPYLRLINRFLKSDLYRGIDVLDLGWGLRGSVVLTGALGQHVLSLRPGVLLLAGFIGYTVNIPLLRHSFYGAAVMAMAGGLGSHDFDPWFP
ncbi:MAG: hypothetical protein PHZ19_01855 [Candidatus Thermoplasmatota archaeon]|nr:hypothetical protein [Candidatus Thermoplasmatota archaeon]